MIFHVTKQTNKGDKYVRIYGFDDMSNVIFPLRFYPKVDWDKLVYNLKKQVARQEDEPTT